MVAALASVVAALVAPPAAAATVRAETIASRLAAGKPVVLKDETRVRGTLDLAAVDVVKRVFRCRRCSFESVSAPDVIFERTLDLTGATFEGRANFRGARFLGPALFAEASPETTTCDKVPEPGSNEEPPEPAPGFKREADFSLTVFDDFVSFADSYFHGQTRFSNARFVDATFSLACFVGPATFDGASFRGAALFGDSHFRDESTFRYADFRRSPDFARARFQPRTIFSGARFADGASFLSADFIGNSGTFATFQNVTSSGTLSFAFALFRGPRVVFSNTVAGGSLVLRDVELDGDVVLLMNELQVRDLVLGPEEADHVVEGDRPAVLQAIEESAKARGDFATANDAHFERRVLKSETYNVFVRALDYVAYRQVAGYLVRPWHPVIVLVLLVTAFAGARMFLSRRARRAKRSDEPRRFRRLVRAGEECGDFTTCWFNTIALAGRRGGAPVIPGTQKKRGQRTDEIAARHRVEALIYRVLLVCALIGFAASNPTLREMVDALL